MLKKLINYDYQIMFLRATPQTFPRMLNLNTILHGDICKEALPIIVQDGTINVIKPGWIWFNPFGDELVQYMKCLINGRTIFLFIDKSKM